MRDLSLKILVGFAAADSLLLFGREEWGRHMAGRQSAEANAQNALRGSSGAGLFGGDSRARSCRMRRGGSRCPARSAIPDMIPRFIAGRLIQLLEAVLRPGA